MVTTTTLLSPPLLLQSNSIGDGSSSQTRAHPHQTPWQASLMSAKSNHLTQRVHPTPHQQNRWCRCICTTLLANYHTCISTCIPHPENHFGQCPNAGMSETTTTTTSSLSP